MFSSLNKNQQITEKNTFNNELVVYSIRLARCRSPHDDLLLAVVVAPLDDLGHVLQGAEARLAGQDVGGKSLETTAGCLRLLQAGEASQVLPADQPQRVLQVALPQRRLQAESTHCSLVGGLRLGPPIRRVGPTGQRVRHTLD